MKLLTSCEYNMDTACVELHYSDGSALVIDCIEDEDTFATSPTYRTELDYPIYNDPLAYAEMVLTGAVDEYLRTVSQRRYLD
ncbi:MAG: hypothetical protein IJV41_10820 [Oscillospiraceae bacterium]|nr:hypothetical protein [Oscillospiraceae bacterium]